ncbi:MAG: hypothetical protein ACYDCF_11570 [Burkholderiales bacterium]
MGTDTGRADAERLVLTAVEAMRGEPVAHSMAPVDELEAEDPPVMPNEAEAQARSNLLAAVDEAVSRP